MTEPRSLEYGGTGSNGSADDQSMRAPGIPDIGVHLQPPGQHPAFPEGQINFITKEDVLPPSVL